MSMNQSEKQRSANAVSGKTARACDSCLRRRARWYCTADDAFLCQACDSSVHSANALARRHDRVRLETASCSPPLSDLDSNLPTWHQGFKRKARTPRHGKSSAATGAAKRVLLVPDLEALAADEKVDQVEEEEEEQLLYRVPIFDPVLSEFCSPPTLDDVNIIPSIVEEKPVMSHGNFTRFDPSDIELAEFAADVENLLGQGLDDDSFCIDGLGLLEAEDNDKSQVKTEMIDAIDTSHGITSNDNNKKNFLVDTEKESSRESLDFDFDCLSPIRGDEVEEQKVEMLENCPVKIGLRLDYDAVIDAWSFHGCSPWTGGERPSFNPDDCWPDLMGMWGTIGGGGEIQGHCGLRIGQAGNGDGGREARVSRYREKRRTRLFSKKIRYEVRKLNAEKRPRMKGRFVKRASFPTTAAPAGPAVFPYA